MQDSIFAGSYERLVYGFDLKSGDPEPTEPEAAGGDDDDGEMVVVDPPQLQPTFVNLAHDKYVSAVACSPRYLASGSLDHTIRLYDLKRRKEIGTLEHHKGRVTSLQFYRNSHLLSVAADGMLCAWRTADWSLVYEMRAHKGGVNCVSVHPTGKLAVTVGADRKLKVWDLVHAKCAFRCRLDAVGQQVQWNPSGTRYVVCFDDAIQAYDVDDEERPGFRLESPTRCLAVCWVDDAHIAVGGEDNNVSVWNCDVVEPVFELKAHTSRVKGIAVVPRLDGDVSAMPHVVSASSGGIINVWDLSLEPYNVPDVPDHLIDTYNTEDRLTCLCAMNMHASWPRSKKVKKEAVEPTHDQGEVKAEEPAPKARATRKPKKEKGTPSQPGKPNQPSSAEEEHTSDGTVVKGGIYSTSISALRGKRVRRQRRRQPVSKPKRSRETTTRPTKASKSAKSRKG